MLRDRDARVYLSGQLLSIFGDSALWLGAAIWVKQLTGSSSQAGLAFFAFGLGTLCTPLAGLVVDRVRRRPLLVATNAVTGLSVLLLLLAGRHRIWLVDLVLLLYGVSYAVITPAQSALLKHMVADELLADANAVLNTGREALRLVSPLLAAAVVAATGTAKPLAIVDSATFAVVVVAVLRLRLREPAPVPMSQSWRRELFAGARHIWQTIVLRQVVIAGAVALAALGFSETLIFAVADLGLHRSAAFVGVLTAVQGGGAVAGGLLSAPLIRRFGEGRVLALGLALIGVCHGVWVSANLPVVLAGTVVAGFGIPIAVVAYLTVIQRRTPDHLQGRALAAADVLLSVPQTTSIAVGAALVVAVDYRILLAAMCVVELGSGLWLGTRPAQRFRGAADTVSATAFDPLPALHVEPD